MKCLDRYYSEMHHSQNKYSKTINIFLSMYIKKRRRNATTFFDVCNQEKRQVINIIKKILPSTLHYKVLCVIMVVIYSDCSFINLALQFKRVTHLYQHSA